MPPWRAHLDRGGEVAGHCDGPAGPGSGVQLANAVLGIRHDQRPETSHRKLSDAAHYHTRVAQTPDWLPYVTPTVAVAAFAVSVWSLFTARRGVRTANRTFERAAPILDGNAHTLEPVNSHGRIDYKLTGQLLIQLWNRGLASTSIDSMSIVDNRSASDESHRRDVRSIRLVVTEADHGPSFPHTLSGQTSAVWIFQIQSLALIGIDDVIEVTDWKGIMYLLDRINVRVDLGNKETRILRINRE